MNKDILEGTWEEIKAKIQRAWSKLTDDDCEEIKSNQHELYGKLQKHYGYTKDEIKKAIDDLKNTGKD